jgi:3-ketosteroid 9alpha-monooxygenase subunit A
MADTAFQGYPRGWFVVAVADSLAVGDVRPLRYFGKDMVLFRGEDGAPVILDAHCPHLGAHLGHGGTVSGNSVQCPFHAWRFGADGACVEIPYAEKIPPRACVKTWPVDEVNGLIFVWHDTKGREPDYRIPVMEEFGADDWTSWTIDFKTINTHPREVIENVADAAHFPRVHGTHPTVFENEFIDHIAIERMEGVAYPRGGGEDHIKIVATYYGPGYQITEMDSALPNRLLNSHTPVDENTLHLRFGVMLKKVASVEKMNSYARGYISNLASGYGEDVEIWEHKVFRERPMLCDGDGPIGKLRKWYAQFYT